MRHFHSMLTTSYKRIILIALVCLASCKSESQTKNQEQEIEHYIVGEWYTIFNEEPEIIDDSDEDYLEIKSKVESNIQVVAKNDYIKKNRFTSNDLLNITFIHTTGSFTMNFKISSSGLWSITDDTVLFDTSFPSLDIVYAGSDASKPEEREIVKFYREEIPSLIKKDLLENETKPSRVIQINKTTLEVEESDKLITKYKRISKQPKEFDISLLPNKDFTEEQLKMGKSIFAKLEAMGDGTRYMLGAVIPKSEGIELYDNQKLEGTPTHRLSLPNSGSQFKKAFIVFDIMKDSKCGQHFKVLSKTGHYGWISGCSNIDTKWINIDEAFTKNQNAKYQETFGVKDLKSVYPNR